MRVAPPTLLLATALASPSLAQASPHLDAPPTPVTPTVQGGQTATSCQWPTSVAIFNGTGLCSATLVHPRVVTSAAHCMHPMYGGYPNAVRFGEAAFDPAFTVPVDFCLYNPNWNGQVGPSDYAFCVLSQAVDLPPTPPLMGCELELMEVGSEVALVGFGNNSDNGGAGPKRWGMSEVILVEEDIIAAGNMDVSTCQGDSGSSGFFQLPDGGWRSWGMLSGGPEGCGNEGYFVNIASVAGWIEDQSGFDITPCHDADGTWNPGPDCLGVATNPAAGGNWNQSCPDTLSEEPATCGPGVNWPEDITPPEVSFTTPLDQEVFPEVPSTFDIVVDTQDEGFAVLAVELYIDGQFITDQSREAWAPYEPWVFANAAFPQGVFELSALAYDYAGNVGESQITIYVGEEPDDSGDGDGDGDPAGDGDGDPTGDESSTETGGDTDTDTDTDMEEETDTSTESGDDPPALPAADSGCSCSSDSPSSPPPAALLLPLLLLGLDRRESIRRPTRDLS